MKKLDLFRGPRLKIDRAKSNIDELFSHLKMFYESKPYEVGVKYDAEFFHSNIPDVKPRYDLEEHMISLSGPIGDAIHNLRASLDVLAVDCARYHDEGQAFMKVSFPFSKSADTFKKAIKDSKIKMAGENIVSLIHKIKPYKGGDDFIYNLHALDILNKHHSIIPVLTTHSWGIGKLGAKAYLQDNKGVRAETLDETLRKKYPSFDAGYYVSETFKLSIYVRFEPDNPFAGELVVPTLLALTSRIEYMVDSFQTTVKRSESG